jgi:hypothetical protein
VLEFSADSGSLVSEWTETTVRERERPCKHCWERGRGSRAGSERPTERATVSRYSFQISSC